MQVGGGEAQRPDADVSPENTELRAMPLLPTAETRRVLGAPATMQADHDLEFAEIVAIAQQAFHSKAALWRS